MYNGHIDKGMTMKNEWIGKLVLEADAVAYEIRSMKGELIALLKVTHEEVGSEMDAIMEVSSRAARIVKLFGL